MSPEGSESIRPGPRVTPASGQAVPASPLEVVPHFIRHFSPGVLGLTMAAAWTARLILGGYTLWDAVAPALIIAAWPVQEWLLHVYILHFRPRRLLGRRVDLYVAKEHRRHHRNPHSLEIVLIPGRVVAGSLVVLPLLFGSLLPTLRLALTCCAVYYTFALN